MPDIQLHPWAEEMLTVVRTVIPEAGVLDMNSDGMFVDPAIARKVIEAFMKCGYISYPGLHSAVIIESKKENEVGIIIDIEDVQAIIYFYNDKMYK